MHYILADIHGNSAAFDKILSMINLQDDDHLYILGDVIDRGPDGIILLQRIREMANTTLLLGNHEYMMINALRNPHDPWYKRVWRRNGCEPTRAAFSALDGKAQEEFLKYLEGLPLQTEIEVDGRVFVLVHAAPLELFEEAGWQYEDEREYAVWHRLPLVRPKQLEGKTLIFGHTPTINVKEMEEAKMRIAHGDGVIDIDCGCAYPQYGGQLGCLRLEDGMEFYSDEGVIAAGDAASLHEESGQK